MSGSSHSTGPSTLWVLIQEISFKLSLLKNAITPNSIVSGDFNLDWKKRDNPNYQFKNYFNNMDVSLNGKSLT
jgi:hypothetical protein